MSMRSVPFHSPDHRAPAAFGAPLQAPWWCSPAGVAVGFLMPMYALVSFAIELNLQGLTARGLRFLTPGYLVLGLGLMAAMALGGWLGQQVTPLPQPAPSSRRVDQAGIVIGVIATTAYAIWFREYLMRPDLLLAILLGRQSPERGSELVTGVTSLANGGPVFFAIYAWRLAHRTDADPLPRAMNLLCAALAGLTAFRVYAWSERLALIEAVLPIALMGAMRATRARWLVWRLVARFGPFIALPALMAYFGLAESVRSWSSDTYNGRLDFWDFVVGRMATYYYTALNNGAGYLATEHWPSYRFEYSFSMLHTAPFGLGPVFSRLVGSTGQTFDAFLQRYADVEFNNPSGLFTVVYDMGVPLGILYFAVVGIVSGAVFRRYVAGTLGGAMFYPLFFTSYLEVFRYPYLGSGRAFAIAVCGVVVLALVHRPQPMAPLRRLDRRSLERV